MKKNQQNSKKAFSLIEISIVLVIVGIIIAGITQSSNLVRKMRISSARSLTQSSPVNSIKDLGVWYDSVSENIFTNSSGSRNVSTGDKIMNWNDINQQNMKYNSWLQGSDSARPTYQIDAINGLPALKFDGDDWLAFANIQNIDSTAFAVVSTAYPGASGQAYSANTILYADAMGGRYDIVPMAIGGGVLQIFTGTPVEATLSGTTIVSTDSPHVLVSSREMKSGALALYVDGKLDASGVGSDGNLIDNPGMAIGYQTNGYIGEIIVYTRVLKDEERKSVESYLAKKWGVKLK